VSQVRWGRSSPRGEERVLSDEAASSAAGGNALKESAAEDINFSSGRSDGSSCETGLGFRQRELRPNTEINAAGERR